jgi:hypothetical protein
LFQEGGKEMNVSQEVLKEAARGDAGAARDRLVAMAECRILAATDMAEAPTERILSAGLIPARAASDAVHIGYAAAHAMDFLLTWNCRPMGTRPAESPDADGVLRRAP